MTQTYTLTAERTPQGLAYLHLARGGADQAPVVLVLHGLGRAKEHMLPTLYAFAQAGYRAVGIDARLHGEREGAEGREARMESHFVQTMYETIAGTAGDIGGVLDALGARDAAMHGVSLGGYITFAALLAEPRLRVATVAMGSPDWLHGLRERGLGPGHPGYDLAALANPLDLAPSHYPPRPLLMLHGDADDVVPVQGVRALYVSLQPLYQDAPERLALTVFPGLAHSYTDDMVTQSVAWTQKFLPAA